MGGAPPRGHASRATAAHSGCSSGSRWLSVPADRRNQRSPDAHGTLYGEKVMKPVLLVMSMLIPSSIGLAQGKGGPPAPPLMECGVHGDIDILCGTRSPEDLELTPDGKSLIVSQFVNGPGGAGIAGLMLFDLAKKTFTRLTPSADPRKDWGDPACPGPIGDALRPHGISLLKRKDGAVQLFVVNHMVNPGGRESIEMFELKDRKS